MKHAAQSEVGGVGRIAEGQVILCRKLSHGVSGHCQRKKLAEKSTLRIRRPMVGHLFCIFTREILGPHVPETCGHQHAIPWASEVLFVVMHFPPLAKPVVSVFWLVRDLLVPVRDVIKVTGQSCHFSQDLGHFKMVGVKRGDAVPEDFAKVGVIASV